MVDLPQNATIPLVFFDVAERYPNHPFLMVPTNPGRNYYPEGLTLLYAKAAVIVRELILKYEQAGYGIGHRVGLLLENRPEYFLHKLALNSLGVCCVPLNPDFRAAETAYVIDHSMLDLIIVIEELSNQLNSAFDLSNHKCPVVLFGDKNQYPSPLTELKSNVPDEETISTILYTSGTTGRPKGCLLSHRYELASGAWYVNRGGLANFGIACERIYNPLPVFHVNAGILSFFGAMLTGNCQVQTDRFHPLRWFTEINETKATVVHYLGVVVPMLLNQPIHALERQHQVRFAIGAGVDPQRHQEFEDRFGYPLIEIWGMTEMVRLIFDADQPRSIGTRAFGRPQAGLEVRVVNDKDEDVPDGIPGEMLIRTNQETPRKDFFSGYLDDHAATEDAWRGGWFHTGDIVVRDQVGILHFVERRKNIIRRSGENIAAAEVEAVLQTHPEVFQAAVLSVQDEIREEEVLACIVLKNSKLLEQELNANHPIVLEILKHCNKALSYYKVPGWIWFARSIPTTGTQKVQKHQIFSKDVDPRQVPGMIDVRAMKRRYG